MGRLIHIDWLLVLCFMIWFLHLRWEWGRCSFFGAYERWQRCLCRTGLGVQGAEPGQEGAALAERQSPRLCCLLSPCRARCVYTWMVLYPYIHTRSHPSHTHSHTEGAALSTIPFCDTQFQPHSRLWGHSHWPLCCLD